MTNKMEKCDIVTFASLDQNPHYTYRWGLGDTWFHEHADFYEIILITSGEWLHDFQDTTEFLKPGDLLLFDVKQRHRLNSHSTGCIHFTMCLSPSYFHKLMGFFPSTQNIFQKEKYYLTSLDDTTFSYLLMLTNQFKNATAEFNKIQLFFYNALSFISPNIIETEMVEPDIANDIYIKIRNLSFLTLSMNDIYKQYPCSIPTIIKKFKQLTGMTPVQFQTSVRLDQATILLSESPLSIEEIAFSLGFHSISHFYEIFKAHFKMTPNAYRKKYERTTSPSKN